MSKKCLAPGGCWRLILKASQVQIKRSQFDRPSCMSKYRFDRVRISILTSKTISATWKPLKADPGGQLSGGQILFFENQTLPKLLRHAWKHIRVWPVYLAGLQDQPPGATRYHLLFWYKKLYAFPNKPIFIHTPICDLPICTWLTAPGSTYRIILS